MPGPRRRAVAAGRSAVPGLPRRQPLEPAGRPPAGGARSARLIASIGLGSPVHPDFGSGLYNGEPIGIPYAVVSGRTRRVPVSFDYASESDGHLYPLPPARPDRGRPPVDRATAT